MAGRIDARLAELNIELPPAPGPAGSYVPYTVSGNQVFISGQLPIEDGEVRYKGRLGKDYDVEAGQKIARVCALNAIAQLRAACGGDLDRVKRCLRLGGFVACTEDFTQQPAVINGASDVVAEIFGDAGLHARAAVGTNALPLGVAVEIESVWEIA
jgi:enamine deaminase RidA (YjgF/YER057c/UK114 family)